MGVLEFTRNDYPTIGVEVELALVDTGDAGEIVRGSLASASA